MVCDKAITFCIYTPLQNSKEVCRKMPEKPSILQVSLGYVDYRNNSR